MPILHCTLPFTSSTTTAEAIHVSTAHIALSHNLTYIAAAKIRYIGRMLEISLQRNIWRREREEEDIANTKRWLGYCAMLAAIEANHRAKIREIEERAASRDSMREEHRRRMEEEMAEREVGGWENADDKVVEWLESLERNVGEGCQYRDEYRAGHVEVKRSKGRMKALVGVGKMLKAMKKRLGECKIDGILRRKEV